MISLTPLNPPSSNIHAEGFDIDTCLLLIQFKDANGPKPEAYAFDGLSPELYDEMRAAHGRPGDSFGKFFAREIKPFPKKYPFHKVSIAAPAAEQSAETVTDFTATGAPLPAVIPQGEILVPEEAEALKAAALALDEQAKAIDIQSAEAYELAATTLLAIARMRAGLESTFRPVIEEKHKAWKAELAILNHYDKPLEEDAKRIKEGMASFHQREQQKAREEQERLQAEADKRAEEEAAERARELQIEDAVAAEQCGEPERAVAILNSPPLPIAPMYRAPVQVMSAAPRKVAGSSYVEKWVHVVERPDLVPDEYKIPDDKSLAALATALKGRAKVSGVRFYDAGNIRTSKRG